MNEERMVYKPVDVLECFIIFNTDLKKFEKSINEYLEDGWILQGSMSVAYDSKHDIYSYYQPVIRIKKQEWRAVKK